MKNQIIYFLAILIISQTFMSTIILTGFYMNQDYISKNQCENRFVNSSCQGQCVLMKKIQQQEEQEQKNIDSKIKEIHLFVNDHIDLHSHLKLNNSLFVGINSCDFLEKKYSNTYLKSIFRPPVA